MNINHLLIESAKKAMKNSYSPYSKFRVGASVLTASGKIFSGANVENASYGLTICAERSAVSAAVTNGDRKLIKMAVISDSAGHVVPCGACLQVLAEFAPEIELLLCNPKGKFSVKRVSEILKMAFKK